MLTKILASLILAAAVFQAQDLPPVAHEGSVNERPQPDRWRGLILDHAGPKDAVAMFGEAESDKPDRLFIYQVNKWFQPGLNKKNLRKQSFRKVDGFDRVDLYYKDDRLVVIQIDFAKQPPPPTALQNIYGLEFVPYVSGLDEGWFPNDYERHKGRVYPKIYPDVYGLVAVAPRSVVSALVSNLGLGSMLKQSMGVRDIAGGGFPGKIHMIQLISRTLENRSGEDLLK